jgi:hypothetical protein
MKDFKLIDVIGLLETASRQGIKISYLNNELTINIQKGIKMDPLFLEHIKENKKELIEYFTRQQQYLTGSLNNILLTDRNSIKEIPLSFSQERLWFIHQ